MTILFFSLIPRAYGCIVKTQGLLYKKLLLFFLNFRGVRQFLARSHGFPLKILGDTRDFSKISPP